MKGEAIYFVFYSNHTYFFFKKIISLFYFPPLNYSSLLSFLSLMISRVYLGFSLSWKLSFKLLYFHVELENWGTQEDWLSSARLMIILQFLYFFFLFLSLCFSQLVDFFNWKLKSSFYQRKLFFFNLK